MNVKDKIEILRTALYKAFENKTSGDVILNISRKIDQFIVDYYRNLNIDRPSNNPGTKLVNNSNVKNHQISKASQSNRRKN